MKKSLIYILAVAAGLFSCEPYKDLHDSVQQDLALQRDNDAIPETLTISEDDTVFATVESAHTGIPAILSEEYRANAYTDGKLVEVTYSVGTLVEAPAFNAPHFVSEEEYRANDGEICYDTKLWSGIDANSALKTITFAAEDYDLTGDGKYDNFGYYDDEAGDFMGNAVANILEAKISYILQTNYPSETTVGNQVNVVYRYYNNGSTNDVTKSVQYNESSNCYYGFKSDNAAAEAMPKILASAYASSEDGFVIMTSYNVFENYVDNILEDAISLNKVHKVFVKEEGEFTNYNGSPTLYMLYDEDYDAMGAPGKYNNFSSSDLPENYLPQFAASQAPYAQVGEEVQYLYKYHVGGGKNEIQSMTFTKTEAWEQTAPIYSTQGVDKFKYKTGADGGTWNVSLAAVITLVTADYALTGDDKYNNFGYYDNKEGEYPEGTPVENIIDAKINHILQENYSELKVDGQEVTVFYQYYDNGTNTVSRNYIYSVANQNFDRQ